MEMLAETLEVTNPQNGKTYYLCTVVGQLKNGSDHNIYFFCLDEADPRRTALPTDMEVAFSKSGLPVAKRKQED